MEHAESKRWEPIDFTVYMRFALPWAALAAAVEILVRVMAHNAGFFADYRDWIVWIIRVAAIVFIARKSLLSFGPSTAIGAIAGIFFGGFIGLATSVYVLFDGFKAWKVFNVFTETVYMAVLCAAVLVAVSAITGWRMAKSQSINN